MGIRQVQGSIFNLIRTRWLAADNELDRSTGLKPYQVAALKQMPSIEIPSAETIRASLPQHVLTVLDGQPEPNSVQRPLEPSLIAELTSEQFEQLLALEVQERGIPIDIFAELLKTGPSLRQAGVVHAFMQKYWRRLKHWDDIRDVAGLVMRRDFDAPLPAAADPVAVKAAQKLRDDGFAKLPSAITPQQAREISDYFMACPGYSRHVPDGCPDPIARYIGYTANDYPFCSYPMHDIVRAPHLLEAAVNPRITEIGQRYFGAVPRLWKIFAHWDLPGSKFLPAGTSIGHYHRDLNDIGMMWLYIYLTDVDEDCGPHGVIPGSHKFETVSTWLRDAEQWGIDCSHGNRTLQPEDFFDGYGYQIAVEVKEAMFADREVVVTGAAGTTFLSNGFTYHRIRNPQMKPRLLCAARYYLTEPHQFESPDRNSDKIPYRHVVDRIGDSATVREMTQSVIEWREPRSFITRTQVPAKAERQHFLIVSNGRTGSTWLTMLLGGLSGVKTDFEYRWNLPRGAEGNPVHYMIPDHEITVRESLDQFAGDASVVGSKLVFSLEWTQRQNLFEKMNIYFDDSVRYIFLTRPYIEVLASFLLRGPVHHIDPEVRIGAGGVMAPILRETFNGKGIDQRDFQGTKEQVFRSLASLVNNDVIGYGLCTGHSQWRHIAYESIEENFEDLARFVGWSGQSLEAKIVLEKPFTKKLPTLAKEKMPDHVLVAEHADILTNTLRRAVKEVWPVDVLYRTQKTALENLRKSLLGI